MLEAEIAGFGASGRNGGWCSALFPASLDVAGPARRPRRGAGAARARCAHGRRGRRGARRRGHRRPLRQGRHHLAGAQPRPAARARAEVEDARSGGAARTSCRLLDADEARRDARGDPDPRRDVHPGLRGDPPGAAGPRPGRRGRRAAASDPRADAGAVDRPRRVDDPTRHGPGRTSCARPRATPPACRRAAAVVPVYSLIIATEPLSADVWDEIGLAPAGDVLRPPAPDHLRPAHRRRPAGLRRPRGAVPLRVADPARLRPRRPRLRRSCGRRWSTCSRCSRAPGSPTRGAARSASRATGAPRSGWTATPGSAGPAATSATASRTTNLAGRTLRDLVLDRDTELTGLPWVGHRSPSWEPEPLRWLGINAGLRAMTLADAEERLTGRPSVIGRVVAPLVGRLQDDDTRMSTCPRPPPGPRLAEGLLTHLERVPVDIELAMRQWEGYVAALAGRGLGDLRGAPADDCPDAVFVEDTVVVYGDLAVITRPVPTSASRRPPAPRRRCAGWATGSRGSRRPGPSTAATSSSTAARSGSGSAGGPTRPASTSSPPSSTPLGADGGRRPGEPGAAPEVRRHRAARRHRGRLRAAGRRPGVLGPTFLPVPGGARGPRRPARRRRPC